MFLILSKVLWSLAQPVSLIVLFLLLGLALSFTRWRKTSRLSLGLATLILGTAAFTNIGYVAIDALENRFTRPATPPAEVAGIIVLGGGMDADVNSVRGGYELNRSGDRFLEALRLALLYPNAKIVITGGSGVLSPDNVPEADAGARLFLDFGIPAGRLVLENAARNTEENANFTKALIEQAPGQTWLLVTSAFHMPRSVGLFRSAGVEVVPWPADYLSTGTERFGPKLDQLAENLSVSTMAMREWLGLLVYWLTGRIDTFVPGP